MRIIGGILIGIGVLALVPLGIFVGWEFYVFVLLPLIDGREYLLGEFLDFLELVISTTRDWGWKFFTLSILLIVSGIMLRRRAAGDKRVAR